MIDWINRLGKWRTLLTGWQLGTRAKGDPEADAVRDHRELSMFLRAEMNSLVALLIKKNILTTEEFGHAMLTECEQACTEMEKRFPGAQATDDGITLDIAAAQGWLKNFKP